MVEHLYERIREARERAGLSVNEAAERLGVSRVQVWRMENKSETISADRLFLIAALYNVDAQELFKGTEHGNQSLAAIYERIGEVVAMVEAEVQRQDAKPPPEVVGEAVVEILRQETQGRTMPPQTPLDEDKYRGLVALLFRQAKKS